MDHYENHDSNIFDDFGDDDDTPIFGVDGVQPEEGKEVLENAFKINTDRIQPDPRNRKNFDPEKLNELARSLEENGLIQPIHVRKDGDGYIITAGERRFRAAMQLEWQSIPCIVADGDIFTMIAENIQRVDLTAVEEAKAYKKAMEEQGLNGKELAAKLGISASKVTRSVRILDLQPRILEKVEAGELPRAVVREVQKIEDENKQWEIVQRYLGSGGSLSVVQKATGIKPAKKPTRGVKKTASINEISFTASSRKKKTLAELAEAARQFADHLESQIKKSAA